MDSKKIGILVALIVVVVVAIVISARRAGIGVTAAMPQGQRQQQLELIDSKTLELISMPIADWEKQGRQATGVKNPHTGTYTMVATMICRACGEKIPALDPKKHGDYDPATAVCPRCGKNPFKGPYRPNEQAQKFQKAEPAQPAQPAQP
jgi:hypothetical protein